MERERLLSQLDTLRARGAVLCVGPPGAGKTTLVASWLETRRLKSIWYQLDAGDADLPTFFHYLKQSAAAYERKGQRPLPALTPEYLADLAGFARRFFRVLFDRLPAQAVLVLDNYQEVPPDSPFHSLIADAVAEMPAGQAIVILTRRDPASSYARLLINERMGVLDWRDLRLTYAEAETIARRRGHEGDVDVGAAFADSSGWVAGFTLLLERSTRSRQGIDADDVERLSDVFNYFAGQFFDEYALPHRRLLLRLGFLPVMTGGGARAMAGTEAIDLLEDLHRRRLFTERRTTPGVTYQFHALFRAFLQHRARTDLAPEALRDARRIAAHILAREEQTEEAIRLHIESGDLPSARGLIIGQAPVLIDAGRWQVVIDSIALLPAQRVEGDSRLLLWRGMARVAIRPGLARGDLEAAHRVAIEQGDHACRLLAAAGVIQSYILEYASFRNLDPWIDALEDGLAVSSRFDHEEGELRVQSALLIALAYRRPSSRLVAGCVERVFHLAQGAAPINLRLVSMAYMLAYGTTTGPLVLAHRALPMLEALIGDPRSTSLNIAWASFIIAHYHVISGSVAARRSATNRIERIAADDGLPFVRVFVYVMEGWGACQAADFVTARAVIEKLEGVVDRNHAYDVASVHSLRMLLACCTGNPDQALEEGAKAVALFDASGSIMHRMLNRDIMASAALLAGRVEHADRLLRELRSIGRSARPTWMEARIRVHEALVLFARGEHAMAVPALRDALVHAIEHGTVAQLKLVRPIMSRVAAHALESGIEAGFIREFVRANRIVAPPGVDDAWPWPIKLYTLGRFSILLDDEPIDFTRKVPRKCLLLLKAIIAMGGREVRQERLMDALWPDESGDAAYEAFAQTLLRLRRILRDASAVQLLDGLVSLNPSSVWVDVDAFGAHGTEEPAETAQRLVRLYRGDFLANESDQPWSASMRERLRQKFIHLVSIAGQVLENQGNADLAIGLYLRGLDADPLAESFYQGLMRCHAAAGRPAEAFSAYRRLRQQLSVILGITPSSSTEALVRRLSLR